MLDLKLATQLGAAETQRLPAPQRAHFGAMLATLHRAGFLWELNSQSGHHRVTLEKAGLRVEGGGSTAEDAVRQAADRYDAEVARSIAAARTPQRALPGENTAQCDALIFDVPPRPRALTGRKRRRG